MLRGGDLTQTHGSWWVVVGGWLSKIGLKIKRPHVIYGRTLRDCGSVTVSVSDESVYDFLQV